MVSIYSIAYRSPDSHERNMETGGKSSGTNTWTASCYFNNVLGFDSRRGLGIFLFTTVSRTALRPTHPPVQWEPGALSLGVRLPGLEADPSPPSSAEVKVCGAIPPLPQYIFMVWCYVKHRETLLLPLPHILMYCTVRLAVNEKLRIKPLPLRYW
jgi:hypothetical protein